MKIRQISLQVPTINVDYSSYFRKYSNVLNNSFNITKNYLSELLFSVRGIFRKRPRTEYSENYSGENHHQRLSLKYKLQSLYNKNRKIFRNSFIVVLAAGLFLFIANTYKSGRVQDTSDTRIEVKDALASVELGREFNFPLKDADGEEVSKIKYFIEKAELRDEIITEGKRATAVKGRIFLILILKISNQYEKPININTRDYIRLSVNGQEEELLAPDTHNDPVEIQAISTKNTRVGFIVNESDKDYILHIGEIKGDKEKINLDLK